MRNTKIWSVLLAAVLLCACIVGVLFVGAQAEGTAYTWYVDGVGTNADSYATIDAAMAAAKEKTNWAAGDTLTINITADGTTSTFNTKNTGGQTNTGRNLFNVITVFRADNTKLPITIDGGEAQNSILITTPVWALNSVKSFSATNDYTFKNLDLSSWGDSGYAFYAGAGKVTFNNVDFGTTQTLTITPSVGGWTPFINWSVAQFEANAAADGILETGFTFLNTDYGMNDGTLICRPYPGGIANTGSATGGGLTIKNNMMRNSIVIGEGSTVTYVNHQKAVSYTYLQQEPAESIIEINGGTVTNLNSVTTGSGYVGLGNKLTATIKAGTVTNLNMGPGASDGKYTGNIEINWLGGTVTNYKSVVGGTVTGTVTNYVVGRDVSGFTANGFNMGGTLSGTLHNIYENCDCGEGRFLGASGKAPNLINTFKGTFTTSNANLYLGTNGDRISGNIINNIDAEFITPSGGVAYGGSNGGVVGGTVTNNILPGAKLGTFIGGCNGGSAAGIVNNITGGEITNYRAAHGINNKTTLASVKNNITGGTITTFQGATSEGGQSTVTNNGTITKVENFIGKVEEDGTYSGDAVITNFNGGSADEVYKVDSLINTFYSGTVTNFYGAGSYKITVGTVENYMYGGTITTYFFGGGKENTVTGNINNYFYETTFVKGIDGSGGAYGGSQKGSIAGTVTNYLGEKDGENPIKFTGKGICGGNQLSGGTVTKVVNHFENCQTTDSVFYAGSRLGAVTTVENNFYDGFIWGGSNFYCGVNNATIKHITNNFYGGETTGTDSVIYCGNANAGFAGTDSTLTNNFLGGTFRYVFGGNVGNSVQGTLTNNFGKVEADGTITGNCKIETFYGGCNSGGTVATLNNYYYSGTLGKSGAGTTAENGNTFGGSKTCTATAINNYYRGTKFLAWVYSGCDTGTATTINNYIDVLPEGTSIFCGNRKGTATTINTTVGVENNIADDIKASVFYGGSRGGTMGTVTTTINSGTLNRFIGSGSDGDAASFGNIKNIVKGGTIAAFHDGSLDGNVPCASIETTIEGNVTFTDKVYLGNGNKAATTTIKKDAVITLDVDAVLNVSAAEGTFTLNQSGYWYADRVYANYPAELDETFAAAVAGETVLGTAVAEDGKLTGKSDLSLKNANFILTERVAIRIVYDSPVLSKYTLENLIVRVNGKNAKVEIDPKNENAIIIYDIGLADFDKQITFYGGYLPALGSNVDSIIELSDFAVGAVVEGNVAIYKAIADFGRAYAGTTLQYGLTYTEVEKTSQMIATPDATKLAITGKNLVMKDAIGFRYYGTLVGDTTIEDIKVYIDGDDYTDFCNIAFVKGSTTEITIDLYLGIKSMATYIEVMITAGDSVALNYVDSGDAIAQKIITAQPEDNALAQAALVYIQTATQM